ncbi:MAG: FtsX-like permease family protein [Planctomycetota bacterium]|nr:FtsX-like permease family protein [Planctomycetota bacterium]
MYRLFLAVRYLLTRPINLLGMGGIMLSVWALVVVVSLFSGFLQVIEDHVRSATADAVISDLPRWSEWPDLRAALADDPNVAAAAPRGLNLGLLPPPGRRPPPAPLPGKSALHGGDQPFLFVYGVDAALEAEATEMRAWIAAPEIPEELRAADLDDPLAAVQSTPAVLIGLQRMQREGLRVGDPLRLTTALMKATSDGRSQPVKVEIDLRVAGAYRTEHGGFDGNNVFVSVDTLRERLFPETPQRVDEVAVRVHDHEQLEETTARLARSVRRVTERDGRGFGDVQSWRERNAQFLANVSHQRGLMKIVLIVIMVVAAFLMLATLSMMVTEKTSDIGILTAMGGTPTGVTTVFLSCGLVITCCGVALGLAVGTLTAAYLEEIRQAVLWATGVDLFPLDVYNLQRVPCRIEPVWLLQVAAMAMTTGLIVSVVPALRAARHDPLVSLRGA